MSDHPTSIPLTVLAILLSLLVAIQSAAAEEGTPDPAPAGSHRLAETVVTGTKTEHAAEEAPVPTQVIPREVIEQSATVGIEQVLDQIPDLYVQQNVEFGLGASIVRMQGADPNKVAILLDGQRFRGGIDGVVDLRDIPAGEIEQIEIIRGPASSLYGSDAMAGVINIRTRVGRRPDPTSTPPAAGGSSRSSSTSSSHGWHVGPVKYFLSAQHDEVAVRSSSSARSARSSRGKRATTCRSATASSSASTTRPSARICGSVPTI